MKTTITKICTYLIIVTVAFSCKRAEEDKSVSINEYVLEDQELYNTIKALDAKYFNAYNTCDIETQSEMVPDNFEFYHDKGGLMTSKIDFLEALKNNICGKVKRTLVEGSVEVYPINNYGAVQIGYHTFFNNQEPDAVSKPSKFIVIWKKENDSWKMSRVVSLH
ncbi:nuclear transport factor 2 family protein [uncultured Lacinutrix sp.]|uniref:nuclear transport factor 2 family protein n=1 Tax=uncultured Lacinutrix sp. TaxID=574032 RepID=UPI0026219A5D|nr:nuclear transport factor 2 family protein [uncultured Lacinutrix sp.]